MKEGHDYFNYQYGSGKDKIQIVSTFDVCHHVSSDVNEIMKSSQPGQSPA